MSQTGSGARGQGIRQPPVLPDLVLWQREGTGPSSPFFFEWGGVEEVRSRQSSANESALTVCGTNFATSCKLRRTRLPRLSRTNTFDVDRLLSHTKSQGLAISAVDEPDEDHDDSLLGFSTTALFDKSRKMSDPARFVDTTELPFLTLSTRKTFRCTGVRLGDWATVINPRTRKYRHAIIGDSRDVAGVDPSSHLSTSLGLDSQEPAIYLLYPGTGSGQGSIPVSSGIEDRGDLLFRQRASNGDPTWEETLVQFIETLSKGCGGA